MNSSYTLRFDTDKKLFVLRIDGSFNETDFDALWQEIKTKKEQLDSDNGIFILTHYLTQTKVSPKVRKKSYAALKDPSFKKVAICGGGSVIRAITSFVNFSSGLQKLKWFKEENSAVEWLREN